MSFHTIHKDNKEEWLMSKKGTIGGSSASAIVGKNPWLNNKQAYNEIMGIKEARNIDDNKAVIYGSKAEQHIRALFELDNLDKYEVVNPPQNGYDLVINDERPYMVGTLDGQLVEKATGRKGVLEIKTSAILSSMQNERWFDKETKKATIPINYYIQVLHYLIVTGYDFAILVAELKYENTEHIAHFVRQEFMIDCQDEGVKNDLEWLAKEEEAFYTNYLLPSKEPPLILNF